MSLYGTNWQPVGYGNGELTVWTTRDTCKNVPGSLLTEREKQMLASGGTLDEAVVVIKGAGEEGEVVTKVASDVFARLGIVDDVTSYLGKDITTQVEHYQRDHLLAEFLPHLTPEQKENRTFILALEYLAIVMPRLTVAQSLTQLYRISNDVCTRTQVEKLSRIIINLKVDDTEIHTLEESIRSSFGTRDAHTLLQLLLTGNVPTTPLKRFIGDGFRVTIEIGRKRSLICLENERDRFVTRIGVGPSKKLPAVADVEDASFEGLTSRRKAKPGIVACDERRFRLLRRMMGTLQGHEQIILPTAWVHSRDRDIAYFEFPHELPGQPLSSFLKDRGSDAKHNVLSLLFALVKRLQKEHGVFLSVVDHRAVFTDGRLLWVAFSEYMVDSSVPHALIPSHEELYPRIRPASGAGRSHQLGESTILWMMGHQLTKTLYGCSPVFMGSTSGGRNLSASKLLEQAENLILEHPKIEEVVPHRSGRYTLRDKCFELLIFACFQSERIFFSLNDATTYWNKLASYTDAQLEEVVPPELKHAIRHLSTADVAPLFRFTLAKLERGVPERVVKAAPPKCHDEGEEVLIAPILPGDESAGNPISTDWDL